MSQNPILIAIRTALAKISPLNRIFIGYSGGIDSQVLLHACVALPEFKNQITAVYIHHGLQKIADDWVCHCEKTTENLGVKFLTFRVDANSKRRESPEEAARNARYEVLKNLLAENDVLLIAQHREDQLETVLLQLFRGSGLKGLAGIPQKMLFGKGELLRPLLNIGKDEITAYALEKQLFWVEDPSNQSTIYDRNFLRAEIIPQLKQRWQSLDKTVARTATHCAQAQNLISEMAQTDLNCILNEDNSLHIPTLLTYSLAKQQLILREWFAYLNLRMPSQDFLQRIISEVLFAAIDRHPILHKKGVTVTRQKLKLVLKQTNQ